MKTEGLRWIFPLITIKARKQKVYGLSQYCALPQHVHFCGAGEGRTPVQTYSPKAFYMLISLLFVGVAPEKNKPMQNLAV